MNLRKISALIAAVLMAAAMNVMAGPADPSQRRIIKLDNGTEKTVQLIGDEYGYCWKSIDNSGFYRERPGLKDRYVEVSELDIRRKAARQRRAAPKHASKDNKSELGYPCTKLNLKGKKRVLAILVNFRDKSFSAANAAEYENIFNAVNYTSGRNKGSVKDYFLAQSNNMLDLDFDVVGPVRVSKNSAYYGAATDDQNDAHAQEMVSEAVALVNDQVDFSRYDWDGDGKVEMIVVIFAGLDQSSGGEADDIWAHKSSIDARYDNVDVGVYACAPEMRKVNNSNQINSIGTICHEISHTFGLPDTYDQSTGNYGTDRWDIMGTGVHNDNGYSPAGYTAYDKMYCLWQTPVVLKESQRVNNIRPMSEGGDFYLIPNDACESEFYLLENRQKTGWDGGLPGHGMLIMHVDYDETLFYHNITNRTGTIGDYTNDHERLGLVLADNDTNIDYSDYNVWQTCLQGDLYPCQSNNQLTNTSTPNAKLFNKNIDDTYVLSKPVTSIRENGNGTMSFQFTNNLISQSICHLSQGSGTVRFVSDSEAKLIVDIKNDGYLDYSRNIGVFVYTWENNSYVIQSPRNIQIVNLSVGEKKTLEFPLSGLEDGKKYYAFLFYYKDPNATTWVQMGNSIAFNMSDRNKFNISMNEENMVIYMTGNTATLEATFHNESYKKYSKNIGVYTYMLKDGSYAIQDPRAFVIGNIEPYSDRRLAFTLNNLKENVQYHVFFFHYSDESGSSWVQMGGPFKVIYDPSVIQPALGDVNADGDVTPSDAIMILYRYFGVDQQGFKRAVADLNHDGNITPSDAIEALYKFFGASQSKTPQKSQPALEPQ